MVEIRIESAQALDAYAAIPASFRVDAMFEVTNGRTRPILRERTVATPYIKDYDGVTDGGPRAWSKRFDLTSWGFFSARIDGAWIGAAAVAPDPTLAPLSYDGDAVLWDLRVAPGQRGRGVGGALFAAVEEWARTRECNALLAETQDINVPACRLYERRGCRLQFALAGAYADFPDEIQLVWRKQLSPASR
jgi:GNAT superfamily N-acetyltransferase